jgi:FkbM family methyltransferase
MTTLLRTAQLVNSALGVVGLELRRKGSSVAVEVAAPSPAPPSDDIQAALDAALANQQTLTTELNRMYAVYNQGESLRVRQTLRGSLQHAHDLGINPTSVIDVGAAYGTPELYEVFTEARHLLIEPLDDYRPYLESVIQKYPRTEYVLAAATSQPGSLTIHKHADLQGSSLYLETEDSPGLNDTPVTVPGLTLDDLCAERGFSGPYVIKVDVQGAELDALAGATRILDQTDYVVLETSLFGFYKGGAQIYDVISFLRERGFAVYDLVNYSYRPLDGAFAQVDVAFVKENSPLRSIHTYATPAQRDALTQQLLTHAPQG